MAALIKANAFRSTKAKMKKDLKNGKVSAQELLRGDDEIFLSMKTKEMLQSLPGIGEFSARRLLDECRIKPNRKIGALGKRQQAALWQALGVVV